MMIGWLVVWFHVFSLFVEQKKLFRNLICPAKTRKKFKKEENSPKKCIKGGVSHQKKRKNSIKFLFFWTNKPKKKTDTNYLGELEKGGVEIVEIVNFWMISKKQIKESSWSKLSS